MKRLFLALWPDQVTRRAIDHQARKLIHKRARPVPAQNLHITLVFLGNVDDGQLDCLRAGCARVACEPFELTIDTVGHWPRPRALWLAPQRRPAALMDLAARLSSVATDCGLKLDARPYRPHITIARKVREWSGDGEIKPVRWPAHRFALVESVTAQEGARYEVLEEWGLGRDAREKITDTRG